MNMGCCGRRTTAMGLLEEADAFPPTHPRGAKARRKIAYSVAAQRARQTGNRGAYERAMAGLRSIDGLGLFSSSDTRLTAAASTAVTSAVTRAATGPSLAQIGTQVAAVVNMLTTIASLATSIAQAAGGDPTAVAVANTVVSWVRAIVNGTPPTIPTLDANTLNGFVRFCTVGTPIKSAVDFGFGAAIAVFNANILAATVAGRSPSASDTQAVSVLTSLVQRLDGMFDGICAAVSAQVVPTQTCPDGTVIPATTPCATPPPPAPTVPATLRHLCWDGSTTVQTWDPATNRWGAGVPPCPPRPQAAGLPTGGCSSGFNTLPPSGFKTSTGAVVPGTAGRVACAQCYTPGRFIPGVLDAQGFWRTPPACVLDPATGAVYPSPGPGYPCPAGTSRGADGDCKAPVAGGGGGGGGGGLLLVGAAALAAKFFLF